MIAGAELAREPSATARDPSASPNVLGAAETRDLFRQTIRHHSKSFSLAARLLPERCRQPTEALYAWCREVDDAIDCAQPKEQAPRLAAMQRALQAVYAGGSCPNLTWSAFQEVVSTYRIPIEYPSELLAGMTMDARGTRYQTRYDLLLYCYRVAGTVGLMMSHVIGLRDERALTHAAHLGIAMQLTNICRDVLEDWQRGRLYLPAELLGGLELSPGRDTLLAADVRERLRTAVRLLLSDADYYYRSGDDGLSALPLRCALSVRAARLIYSEIGAELGRRDYDVLSGRASVSAARKLRLLIAAGWGELRALGSRPRFVPVPLNRVVRYPDDVVPV